MSVRLIALVLPALVAFKAEGPVDLDNAQAAPTLQNYMNGRYDNTPFADQVPDGLQRSIVQDEARIISVDGERVCFEVVTRTSQGVEDHRGQYSFKVHKTEVWPEGEPAVEAFDYDFNGQRTVLDLSVFTRNAGGNLLFTQPTENTLRVVQRTWTVCGSPAVKKGRIDLRVFLAGRDYSQEAMVERYRWHVR
ncbi:MAG: hypothetical protein AB8H79_06055 [Myxococcota bacterium]